MVGDGEQMWEGKGRGGKRKGGEGRGREGRERILSVMFPCCSIPAAAVEAAGGGEKEEMLHIP